MQRELLAGEDRKQEEKFTCSLAGRWSDNAPRGRGGVLRLTCIHRMCRHSCPGTLRLGEGLLFLLLLTNRREEISDFPKRPLPVTMLQC